MEFTGKIIAVGELKQGNSKTTGKPWADQEYTLEFGTEEHKERLSFDIFGEEKINAADLKVGDEATINVNFNASEYNGRWYNRISAWSVKNANSDAPKAEKKAEKKVEKKAENPIVMATDGDLPF